MSQVVSDELHWAGQQWGGRASGLALLQVDVIKENYHI